MPHSLARTSSFVLGYATSSFNYPARKAAIKMCRSAYHRVSDDSVSSFGGHATMDEAIREAEANIKSPDIDTVWVRDSSGNVVFEKSS